MRITFPAPLLIFLIGLQAQAHQPQLQRQSCSSQAQGYVTQPQARDLLMEILEVSSETNLLERVVELQTAPGALLNSVVQQTEDAQFVRSRLLEKAHRLGKAAHELQNKLDLQSISSPEDPFWQQWFERLAEQDLENLNSELEQRLLKEIEDALNRSKQKSLAYFITQLAYFLDQQSKVSGDQRLASRKMGAAVMMLFSQRMSRLAEQSNGRSVAGGKLDLVAAKKYSAAAENFKLFSAGISAAGADVELFYIKYISAILKALTGQSQTDSTYRPGVCANCGWIH